VGDLSSCLGDPSTQTQNIELHCLYQMGLVLVYSLFSLRNRLPIKGHENHQAVRWVGKKNPHKRSQLAWGNSNLTGPGGATGHTGESNGEKKAGGVPNSVPWGQWHQVPGLLVCKIDTTPQGFLVLLCLLERTKAQQGVCFCPKLGGAR